MLVREVEPEKLDPQYPWFLQEKVHAEADVTVAYIRGKLFAFALDRASFEGDDYRLIQTYQDLRWKPLMLTDAEQQGMRLLMETMGLDFGRFDFLRKDGELWFLELNPNGQWAWLDDYSEVSLVDLVCEELKRAVA